jgi:fructose 1,6-bisphosphatase
MHPKMLAVAESALEGVRGGLMIDGQVASCGDDLHLLMTHRAAPTPKRSTVSPGTCSRRPTALARELGLYGAGQDLLSDAFSGNLRGMGPGYAELEFKERPSETVLRFLADKTEPGAWNLPLYRIFADPFNTAGLVIDPRMHAGFALDVHDPFENRRIVFDSPEDLHHLLRYIGAPSRYVVQRVTSGTLGEPAAVTSTQRLALMAGRYVGKDDPVMIVRSQSGLPAVGEILEPLAFPHTVFGCMRLTARPADAGRRRRRAPEPLRRPAARRLARLPDHQPALHRSARHVRRPRIRPRPRDRERSWTTCTATAPSSPTGCRSTRSSTPRCPAVTVLPRSYRRAASVLRAVAAAI